jgi:hypothetical protein
MGGSLSLPAGLGTAAAGTTSILTGAVCRVVPPTFTARLGITCFPVFMGSSVQEQLEVDVTTPFMI